MEASALVLMAATPYLAPTYSVVRPTMIARLGIARPWNSFNSMQAAGEGFGPRMGLQPYGISLGELEVEWLGWREDGQGLRSVQLYMGLCVLAVVGLPEWSNSAGVQAKAGASSGGASNHNKLLI
jgi:hypothetical protein